MFHNLIKVKFFQLKIITILIAKNKFIMISFLFKNNLKFNAISVKIATNGNGKVIPLGWWRKTPQARIENVFLKSIIIKRPRNIFRIYRTIIKFFKFVVMVHK